MPYPTITDPQVVRALHRKLFTALDRHLLWAFNPSSQLPRSRSAAAAQR
jgi:hypothetical protein